MIDIHVLGIQGFYPAIVGMRNPLNSWEKSDTVFADHKYCEYFTIQGDRGPFDVNEDHNDLYPGEKDTALMKRLALAGDEHAKYRRMIAVWIDIKAPLYWWKEFDTYKVGTVANSCSTMHTLASKPFELSDFSIEHLMDEDKNENYMLRAQIKDHFYDDKVCYPLDLLSITVSMLEKCRIAYKCTEDPKKKEQYWWQMIQLLPSSCNQIRTVSLNYQVLANMYRQRKNHKLDEWRKFCDWIETLPLFDTVIAPKKEESIDSKE